MFTQQAFEYVRALTGWWFPGVSDVKGCGFDSPLSGKDAGKVRCAIVVKLHTFLAANPVVALEAVPSHKLRVNDPTTPDVGRGSSTAGEAFFGPGRKPENIEWKQQQQHGRTSKETNTDHYLARNKRAGCS